MDKPIFVRERLTAAFSSMHRAIDLCHEHQLIVPTLVLLYSAIDTAGWLDSMKDGEGVEKSFTRWVERYMQPRSRFGCTALELYAARCGLVHSLGVQSRLAKRGLARKVIYAHHNETPDRLHFEGMSEYVPVKVEDLIEAFRFGLKSFVEDITTSDTRALQASKKANSFLRNMPSRERDALYEWARKKIGGGHIEPKVARDAARVLLTSATTEQELRRAMDEAEGLGVRLEDLFETEDEAQ